MAEGDLDHGNGRLEPQKGGPFHFLFNDTHILAHLSIYASVQTCDSHVSTTDLFLGHPKRHDQMHVLDVPRNREYSGFLRIGHPHLDIRAVHMVQKIKEVGRA